MFHVKHKEIQRLAGFDVPPPVIARLQLFADLIAQWSARVNLVSRSDLPRLWCRHIADSLQLIPLIPKQSSSALDLGSGAGFPGLVIAIATDIPFTLVEVDQRKGVFLQEAARLTRAPIRVLNSRIEHIKLSPTHILTARALAPLPILLAFAEPLLAPDGIALFPKGKNLDAELTEAVCEWHMRIERFPSRTNPEACVLRLSEIRRVRP